MSASLNISRAWWHRWALGLVVLALGLGAAKPPIESVVLFDNRKVEIAVPEGLRFSGGTDPQGAVVVQLADEAGSLSLSIVFMPDPDGDFRSARERKEKLFELFNTYVEGSVEKTMMFEELEPVVGAGTYCVFTDTTLVGQTKFPPNEFLHLTCGIKSMPGVVALVRLFSNDTDGKHYKAVLTMLRDSVHERRVPMKPAGG